MATAPRSAKQTTRPTLGRSRAADAGQRFCLSAVTWQTYVTYADSLGERHVRVTYDGGEMELMTLSFEHEEIKSLIADLLTVVRLEMRLRWVRGGSMTFRRDDLARGLEPDECYWIANADRVRGLGAIDLDVAPPPDLVVEVEVSRSMLNRLRIYASLGVPEVWRFDGEVIHFLALGKKHTFRERARSLALPFLTAADLNRFLALPARQQADALDLFQAWVRERAAAGWR